MYNYMITHNYNNSYISIMNLTLCACLIVILLYLCAETLKKKKKRKIYFDSSRFLYMTFFSSRCMENVQGIQHLCIHHYFRPRLTLH